MDESAGVRLVAMDDHDSLDYSLGDPFHRLRDYRHHFFDDYFDFFLDRGLMEYSTWNSPLTNYSLRSVQFQHVQSPSKQVLHPVSRFPSWVDDNVDQCDQEDHYEVKRLCKIR